MANLYTKTGDAGTTSLVGGSRVSKASIRCESYGTIDEAMSMIGLAKAKAHDAYTVDVLETIQARMFALGSELASDKQGFQRLVESSRSKDADGAFIPVSDQDVTYLETICDTCAEQLGTQFHFVKPGVDEVSATLHIARTIVRRAERCMVRALSSSEELRPTVMKFVNRLSDALYALARRYEEHVCVSELADTVFAKVQEALAMNETASPLSLAAARRMATRAEEKSKELGVPTVFFAVDAGGNLIYSQRMEGALLGSIDVAQAKAWSAAAFQMSTDELGRIAAPGNALYSIDQAKPGKIVLFGGGYPVKADGKLVGAIGVSGGTVEQDMTIARYALGNE